MKSLNREGILFSFILIVEILNCLYLIFDHRVPGGHDGFQYFSLQYYFLNDRIISGEIPQWMPFMVQGTSAAWLYAVQASIFQNAALMAGGILKDVNFITVFNIGIFFDKLVLLTGVWLLSRRFFISPYTIFFVAITVMFSCVWMLQPYFNFHFYFAIPLILFFLHVFFESGKWRYFFLAGNLFLLQSLGTGSYHFVLVSLTVFLYLFFYFIAYPEEWRHGIRKMRWNLSCLICLSFLGVSFAALYRMMSIEMSELVIYSFGRNSDQTQSLQNFLTYSANFYLKPWLECLIGVSPAFDYTVYMGFLSVPFIILGLIPRSDKKNVHFISLALLMFLFSCGALVASFFYYVWPMMKFYRHLSLVLPIIKLFLCFIAGFGFEFLFDHKILDTHPRRYKLLCATFCIITGWMVLFLCNLSRDPDRLLGVVNGLVNPQSGLPVFSYARDTLLEHKMSIFFGTASFVTGIFLFFCFKRKHKERLLFVVIAIQMLNLSSYGILEMFSRTVPIYKAEQYKITAFQLMPFTRRRETQFLKTNGRESFLDNFKSPGILYWSTHSFLFKDQLGNPFKTVYWLKPIDSFMRAYWGQSIDDRQAAIVGLNRQGHLVFPLDHPAAGKISAATEDKIQFFSAVCSEGTDNGIARDMTNPAYRGDFIFLTDPDNKRGAGTSSGCMDGALAQNMRVNIPYEILNFSSNRLSLSVDVPLEYKSLWMLYSDVWHPGWRATVNNNSSAVFKANLAYKAVELRPGKNEVSFLFGSKFISFTQWLIGLNSLFWIGAIIFWMARIIRGHNT